MEANTMIHEVIDEFKEDFPLEIEQFKIIIK